MKKIKFYKLSSIIERKFLTIILLYMGSGRVLKRALKQQEEPPNNGKERNGRIYIYWHQGLENAPLIVKKCYESVKQHCGDREIVLIDKNNMERYVSFPNYITEKFEKGLISTTHFSDLLRLELLRNGGYWIDSTVLVTSGKIFDICEKSKGGIFLPGFTRYDNIYNSWFIYAKPDDKILNTTRKMLHLYWMKNNELRHYFLLQIYLTKVCKHFKSQYAKIETIEHSKTHQLWSAFFKKYNQNEYERIKTESDIHKLSYKYSGIDVKNKDYFFNAIITKDINM